MQESIADRPRRIRRTRPSRESRKFAARREATVERLVRAGLPRIMAEGWIDAWDESTIDLSDFRNAPDFWAVGYRFAEAEYERAQANAATTH
jgi:hypothetical protein